jgi:hypothetical protein
VFHGLTANGLGIEDGEASPRYLKNVSATFAQMPNRITSVEFTTVSPTIANRMMGAVFFSFLNIQQFALLSFLLILR